MITNKQIHELAEIGYAKRRGTDHRIGYLVAWNRRKADGSPLYCVFAGVESESIESDSAGYLNKADAIKLARKLENDGYTGVYVQQCNARNGAEGKMVDFRVSAAETRAYINVTIADEGANVYVIKRMLARFCDRSTPYVETHLLCGLTARAVFNSGNRSVQVRFYSGDGETCIADAVASSMIDRFNVSAPETETVIPTAAEPITIADKNALRTIAAKHQRPVLATALRYLRHAVSELIADCAETDGKDIGEYIKAVEYQLARVKAETR